MASYGLPVPALRPARPSSAGIATASRPLPGFGGDAIRAATRAATLPAPLERHRRPRRARSLAGRHPSAPLRASFVSTSVLFLLFMMALGAISVVNGLWTKNLVVNGRVETGDLAADWDNVTTNDAAAPALSSGDCAYLSGIGTQIANVKITGATTDYQCTITGQVSNTGSVPFNIIGALMVINSGNEAGLDQLGTCSVPANPQVDPGSEGPIACTVHVKPTAQPGWTYYFAIEVCAAQWNEDPSTGGADADFTACKTSPQHEGPGTPAPHAPQPTP